jgi:hypothetical protein
MPSLSFASGRVTAERAEPALALYRYDWHLGHLIPISPPTAPTNGLERGSDGYRGARPTFSIEGVDVLVAELLAA